MQYHQPIRQKRRYFPLFLKSKLTRLFIKAFGITVIIALFIFTASWLTLRYNIRPPVPGSFTGSGTNVPAAANGPHAAAFIRPEQENAKPDDHLPYPEPPESGERKMLFYTFLIIGLDEGVNTDTIMVAAYDGVAKQAYIVGIPRDTKVNVNRRTQRINAAYPVGTLNGGGREGGINQLKREIRTLVGFVPDYTVMVDFEAFVRMVDAVNGIEIDVPFDMKYDDPYQGLTINISKGIQTLYGDDALRFARYRLGNDARHTISDYQRIGNQQAVIQALLKKLLRPANVLRIPEFVGIFNKYTYTDIKMHEMLWFAEQLNEVRGKEDALKTYTLPTVGTSGPPIWYELADEDGIIELVNRTVNPYLRDIGTADLDIIN
jgi:LCP family protein required for cell wall assembly